MLKVSNRIRSIIHLLSPQTEELWDLCCDHGLIGYWASVNLPCLKDLYFLDIKKNIVAKAKSKVASHIPKHVDTKFLIDHAKNTLVKKPENSSLIIAGIGGRLSIEIITEVLKNNLSFELVVSAHDNIYELRNYLSSSGLYLLEAKLILDNGKYYEMFKLTTKDTGSKVSIYGELGHYDDDLYRKYLEHEVEFLSFKLKHVEDLALRKRLNAIRELQTALIKT